MDPLQDLLHSELVGLQLDVLLFYQSLVVFNRVFGDIDVGLVDSDPFFEAFAGFLTGHEVFNDLIVCATDLLADFFDHLLEVVPNFLDVVVLHLDFLVDPLLK